MKNILLLFILFYSLRLEAQQPNSDYKYIFQLSETQQASFKIIEQDWFDKIFNPYSAKMKVKISDCRKCGDLYVDFEGKINNNGILKIDASISKECGKKMTSKQYKYFTEYFDKKVFPKNLRNLKIQHRLGILYKC